MSRPNNNAGILYDIPANISNMLFAYLSAFSTYDLERLKEVYRHQIRCESNRSEYVDILDCIEDILDRRELENDK